MTVTNAWQKHGKSSLRIKALKLGGQIHAARAAVEQFDGQLLLQPLHLPADG
jgi:hypothetical protein